MRAGAFGRLLMETQARMWRRRVAALREQSWLMVSVIFLFVLGYWVVGFVMFRLGFGYVTRSVPGIGGILMDRMLYLFFAFLFTMLIFSNMIIGYAGLYKSRETQWLLTLPVGAGTVFCWKLAETAVLASWAFVFLSAPLMLAYGLAREVSGWFYVTAVLLFVPFIVIPATVGALVILLATRFFQRRVFRVGLFAVYVGGVVVVAWLFVKPVASVDVQGTQLIGALNQLMRNSRLALQPLLPSYWVSSGLIAWGEGWWQKGGFYFLVLLSNALLGGWVCVAAGGRMFYEGWTRNHAQGDGRLGWGRLGRLGMLERLAGLWPMHPATRALVVKDIRTFWRDTTQWSQFMIFFGLLGMYVLNLRNVTTPDWDTARFWVMFMSFLNLGAASMTLATLTTRFAFPQFSMEGKRLWLVGMVPFGMKRVLLEKFWLSSVTSGAITLTLMTVSSWMLKIPVGLAVLFGATVVLMSFALCGIAVGIGVLFPNFGSGSGANRQDDNPSKIVSGFGGTLCFVLSLFYIIVVIALEALPVFGRGFINAEYQPLAMVGAWLGVAIISLIAMAVPMSLAAKRLESLEM